MGGHMYVFPPNCDEGKHWFDVIRAAREIALMEDTMTDEAVLTVYREVWNRLMPHRRRLNSHLVMSRVRRWVCQILALDKKVASSMRSSKGQSDLDMLRRTLTKYHRYYAVRNAVLLAIVRRKQETGVARNIIEHLVVDEQRHRRTHERRVIRH